MRINESLRLLSMLVLQYRAKLYFGSIASYAKLKNRNFHQHDVI